MHQSISATWSSHTPEPARAAVTTSLNSPSTLSNIYLAYHAADRREHDHTPHLHVAIHSSRSVPHGLRCTVQHVLIVTCNCADDDDDLDEDAIPGFSHPGMVATPRSAVPDKGKGRATAEQLASPAGGSEFPRTPLSGNIGSASNGGPPSARRVVGGVQVETR